MWRRVPVLCPRARVSRSFSSGNTMNATMKAAVLTRTGAKFRVEQQRLQIPVPKQDEILVKVKACGVCHTDLHVMKDEVAFPVPCVMGHEISGEVAAVGPNTDFSLNVGTKVVSPFIMPCGHCAFCTRGKEDLCETFFSLNRLKGTLYDGTTRLFQPDGTPVWMYSMGGLAEYCVVPKTAVFELGDGIPFADSCIIGCAIFTAYGAVRHGADLRPGQSVAVIGTGGVGSNVLQIARAFGATSIVAVDICDDKLSAARSLGATQVINSRKSDVVAALLECTGGKGVDVAIEALGHANTFAQAVNAVCDGGKAVMVGIAPKGVLGEVEITRLVRRQIQIIGSYGAKARQDVPVILDLVRGGFIDVSAPITRRYSLTDAAHAYEALAGGTITGRAIIDMELTESHD